MTNDTQTECEDCQDGADLATVDGWSERCDTCGRVANVPEPAQRFYRLRV